MTDVNAGPLDQLPQQWREKAKRIEPPTLHDSHVRSWCHGASEAFDACADELDAVLRAAQEDESPIEVMYGEFTDREYAILEAHRWQVAHGAENTPTPSEAYGIIVHLLMLLPPGEVEAALKKGRESEQTR